MILGLLAVLVLAVLVGVAWFGLSLLMLAHCIGEPRRRPRRRYTDSPPPGIH